MGHGVDFRDVYARQVGKHLPKHAVSADDEAAVILRGGGRGLRRGVYHLRALDHDVLPREHEVFAPRQRPAARKIVQRAPADDHGRAHRQLAEAAAVGRDHERLRALSPDAPVGIDGDDRIHGSVPPYTAMGIFPVNSLYSYPSTRKLSRVKA